MNLFLPTLVAIATPRPSPLIAVELAAEKSVIRADGRSTTVITARVQGDRGAPVPDGTVLRFSTTLGRLDATVVETRNGVARVTLTAADQVGVATLTANLDTPGQAVPARITISFSNDAVATESADRWLRFSGSGYNSFAMGLPGTDGRYLDAVGTKHDARLTFRDAVLTADHIQLRLGTTEVVAEGSVVLKQGGRKIAGYRLRYDFGQQKGLLERSTGRFELAPGLIESAVPPLEPGVAETDPFVFADLSAASLVIGAKAIAVSPDNRIQFRRATFYINGQKAFSAPFHYMTPQQQTLFREQLIGVGPAGVTLDIPLYYDVRPAAVGTVHIRRGAQFGSSIYSYRAGWTVDLDQAYNARGGVEGLFQVTNIARQDRGFRVVHRQKLGAQTDLNLFSDLIGGRDLFASTQVGHSFSRFRLNWNASLTRYRGFVDPASQQSIPASGDRRQQLLLETFPRRLSSKARFQYTFSGSMTDQRFFGPSAGLGGIQTQNVATRLVADTRRLGPQTQLLQSAVIGYTWVKAPLSSNAGQTGASVQTTTGIQQELRLRERSLGALSLSYDYSQLPPLFRPTGLAVLQSKVGRHRLSTSANIGTDDWWGVTLAASRGLDTVQNSLYAEARARLARLWGGRLRVSDTQFSSFRYRDQEFAVVRVINGREVALYYSTTTRRFQLDLGGVGY